MLSALRRRLRQERGFTLIELLVVIIILGILVAIAVPSYLSFRSKAANTSAQADIRALIPSVEAYYSDNSSYSGMTLTKLQAYDQAIDMTKYALGSSPGASYCVQSPQTASGVTTYYKNGPSSQITTGACS